MDVPARIVRRTHRDLGYVRGDLLVVFPHIAWFDASGRRTFFYPRLMVIGPFCIAIREPRIFQTSTGEAYET